MVFVEPEQSVCDQEVPNFAPPEVKNERAPIAVFALPRISVFVETCTVKLSQTKGIFGEMPRNPVQDDSDSLLVAAIDEMAKLVRISKAACRCIVAGDLGNPGALKRM